MENFVKKTFKNFKYHGIYVYAFLNEENLIKKSCYQPKKEKYQDTKHYFRKVFNFHTGKMIEPNGIQIDTSKISTIDVDIPKDCDILDRLLNDCKYYVKTKKGFHFYFKKENVLSRNEQCGVADINMDKLWYVPEYFQLDIDYEKNEDGEFKYITKNNKKYKITSKYEKAENSYGSYELIKNEELVDMPQYAIDWCKTVIKFAPKKDKNTNKSVIKNVEKLIINPDYKTNIFDIKTINTILKIFYDNEYFDKNHFKEWVSVAYMTRHLNNSEEAFQLFDKYSRKVEEYKNNSEYDNRKFFYGNNEYNINFDENGVLLKCSKLDSELYRKCLQSLYVSKYTNIVNKFNKQYIYDIENDDNNLMFNDWNINFKALCIKSPYGTGKTCAFRELIKKHQYGKILFITYRQSLAHSFSLDLKTQFGFENYLDENIDVKNSKRIIIQLDSLKRLTSTVNLLTQKDRIPYYDLVVLDECEGLLSHLSFDKIEQYYIHNILTNILKKSKKVLVLDGDLGDRTLDFITTLDFDYKIYENEYKGTKKHFIFSHNIETFDKHIDDDIKAGKKTVIICMTKTESEKYYMKYNEQKYNVIIHNSIEKNKDVLLEVNKKWAEADVLIYSPSVESGVDFNIVNYFYKCYATLSNQSTSSRAFFQMLNRVRNYENNDIMCLIPNHLEFRINSILCRFDEMKLNKWNNIELNNLTTILIHNDVEKYNSKKHFITCIVQTLLKKGHSYEYLNDKPKHKISNNQIEMMKEAIIKSKDITDIEFDKIIDKQRQNKTISRTQNLQVQKHIYKKVFKKKIIDNEFMDKHYNKIDVIKNYKFLNIPINEREQLEQTDYLKQFKYIKCDNILKLINVLGYNINNNNIEVIESKKEQTYKQIKTELYNIITNKKFKQLFEIEREVKENNILTIVEGFLNNYGIDVNKKAVKIKEDGKLINDNKLILKQIDIISEYEERIKQDKEIDTFLDNDLLIEYDNDELLENNNNFDF